VQDRTGILWIGTFGHGIERYNLRKHSVLKFNEESDVGTILSKNDILSLYEDRSGTLWLGTHLGDGLINLGRSTVKFKQIRKRLSAKTGLNDDVVWSICEGDDAGIPPDHSTVWIGTYKGGLNRFDRKTGKFFYYKTDKNNPASISDNLA